MSDSRRSVLSLAVWTLVAVLGNVSSAQAQINVDRELARARNEWAAGTPEDRSRALHRLSRVGEAATLQAPIVIAALSDPDPTNRLLALGIVGDLESVKKSIILKLSTLLSDPDVHVRVAAAQAVASLGAKAEPAIPALVKSLRADPEQRCPEAAAALAAIGDSALPAFARLLRDRDPDVRKTAIGGLGQLDSWQSSGRAGAIGVNLAPQVEALASDPDIGVRTALATMLAGCQDNSQAALVTLQLLARDPAVEVRSTVARVFARPGFAIRGPASWWLALAKDCDRTVRIEVVQALPQTGLSESTVMDRLLDALKDPDAEVRAAAAGRLADEEQLVWVADKTGRSPTWSNTKKLLDHSPTAFAAIKSAIADPDPRVRAATTNLLPVFKAEAVAMIPALEGRIDPDERIRTAAAAAIAGSKPDSKCADTAHSSLRSPIPPMLRMGMSRSLPMRPGLSRPLAGRPRRRCAASCSPASTPWRRRPGHGPGKTWSP